MTPQERARFTGLYRTRKVDFPPVYHSYERTYRVYDENGRLMIQPLGEPPERLLKQDERTFARAAPGLFRFVFTVEDGRATEVTLYVGERAWERGRRIKESEGAHR